MDVMKGTTNQREATPMRDKYLVLESATEEGVFHVLISPGGGPFYDIAVFRPEEFPNPQKAAECKAEFMRRFGGKAEPIRRQQ